MATNHPDQVREGLWKTLGTLRDDWFAAQQGATGSFFLGGKMPRFIDIEGELGKKDMRWWMKQNRESGGGGVIVWFYGRSWRIHAE